MFSFQKPFMLIVYFASLLCKAEVDPRLSKLSVRDKTCTIKPSQNGSDDAPAILQAFHDCGEDGRIVFLNETYHINTVMNTTGLRNCEIDLYGTLLWSTNISYWLNHSLAYGYQNQSSVWWLGGENISMNGHGYGTFDGNGQTWYDFVKGVSNYPNRPEGLTIWNTRDSVFSGLRFVQSQMWTMTVFKSSNILLQDIYVNSSTSNHNPARNTDGADTIYTDNIHFDRWTVVNGDDSISTKANSTNILITNCTFINGLGVALGSIGQYLGQFEIMENITARDCVFYNTLHAGYVKTWTGQQVGYPPNGGGGGLGYAKNIHFHNLTLHNTTTPFSISQCTTFSGVAGDCNSSLFQISDIDIADIVGTMKQEPVASYQCSVAAPCRDISMQDVQVSVGGMSGMEYSCSNVEEIVGFNCTGGT